MRRSDGRRSRPSSATRDCRRSCSTIYWTWRAPATGQLALRVRAVDPGRAVAQAIDKLRPLAAERSVLVERTLDPRVGAVAADPQRLEQVVRVLLLAALRATADRDRRAARPTSRGRR
jgi:signal transduction histidine kinase